MKRWTLGLMTLLTGAAITACGAPTSTTPAATSGAGTGSTSATTSSATSATSTSGDSSATSTSGDTSATSTSGDMEMATTEATMTSGMEMATTEATTTSGSSSSATSTSATSTSATSTSATSTSATSAATGNTIVDVAGQQGNFTTLVTALQATGLDKQLSAAGEYTVFAPTDAAFAALPANTLTSLLANPTLLTQILSYHVAQGELMAADVSSATSIPTVEGQAIEVSTSGGTVTLNGEAKVTSTDIQTSNGVIHVIDKVLLPPGVTLP